MSFPRALPMLWVIPIKTGLRFRAVNLALFFWLLILEQCIFLSSSCHNDQTLTLVLVLVLQYRENSHCRSSSAVNQGRVGLQGHSVNILSGGYCN